MSAPRWVDGDEAVLRALEAQDDGVTPPCEEELLEAGHTIRARVTQRQADRYFTLYGENRFPRRPRS